MSTEAKTKIDSAVAVDEAPGREESPSKLDAFLPSPEAAPTPPKVASGMRSARLIGIAGRTAIVAVRGDDSPIEIQLDPDVDAAVIQDALETGERVMVEADEDGQWVVVGVLRSRKPEKIVLSAAVVEIDAEREVLLRSGKAAMRLREDGDIELVGSRISAASRGLFRLVGRMLRLN